MSNTGIRIELNCNCKKIYYYNNIMTTQIKDESKEQYYEQLLNNAILFLNNEFRLEVEYKLKKNK